jgi:GTP pyrophosphokinase
MWGMDSSAIAAGLLHDSIEDTFITIDEIRLALGDETGSVVADIVIGVTKVKPTADVPKKDRQAEYTRNLIRATRQELRIPIVKLADRLHNMKTLKSMPDESRKSIAKETLDVYCPLAHALGMARVRRTLDELGLRYSEPERYEAVRKAIKKIRRQARRQLTGIIAVLKEDMAKRSVKGELLTRLKSASSTDEYLRAKKLTDGELSEIKNLLKVIVICPDKSTCYRMQEFLHRPEWRRREVSRDGFAYPRRNRFSALLEWRDMDEGYPFEFQIYTESSYRIAQLGITSDWHYKPDKSVPVMHEPSLAWLDDVFTRMFIIENNDEFIKVFRSELNASEIRIYVKNGERIFLPAGATPIDAAYQISSLLGHEASGCRINGRDFPLTAPLQNGVRIEILKTKGGVPKEDWLKYVCTRKAKDEIRSKLAEERYDQIAAENIKIGRRKMRRAATKAKVKLEHLEEFEARLAVEFNLSTGNELYRDIGFGKITATSALDRLSLLISRMLKHATV